MHFNHPIQSKIWLDATVVSEKNEKYRAIEKYVIEKYRAIEPKSTTTSHMHKKQRSLIKYLQDLNKLQFLDFLKKWEVFENKKKIYRLD